MIRAREQTNKNREAVELLSVCYEEDQPIVPSEFTCLSYLERSAHTEFEHLTKKLPIVQDIINSALENSQADILVLTNSDIGVQQYFYDYILCHFANNPKCDALIINRRDNIPKKLGDRRLGTEDLSYFYQHTGRRHPGKDCFVVRRTLLEKVDLQNLFIGYPPWGDVFTRVLQSLSSEVQILRMAHLTFHIGCDKQWHTSRNPYTNVNRNTAKQVKKRYNIKDNPKKIRKNLNNGQKK